MSKICLLDNDIIVKLTACNLFDETINILDKHKSNLMILPSAKYYFRRSRRAKKQYPEVLRNKVTAIANRYPTIEIKTKEAITEVNKLQTYEGIDDGEANLIAATRELDSFWLTTGDKRFLKTLASFDELEIIRLRLQGKVICLEQLILQLIYTQGFESTLLKVLPGIHYDTALRAIFGSGNQSTERNVLDALKSYIEDLRIDTKGILRRF